jgi:serine/threonine protein kinase
MIVDNNHKYDPADDVEWVEQLLARSNRDSRFAFNRFENNLIVIEVQTQGITSDLLMIDLRPYSPGRTGLMNYIVMKETNPGNIVRFDEFICIEMDHYQCTTQRLWNIVIRSLNRDKLIMHWTYETMEYLEWINDCGFIHCNLSMSNVVIDSNGHIIIMNYGESMLTRGCARTGRGHYKYSALKLC